MGRKVNRKDKESSYFGFKKFKDIDQEFHSKIESILEMNIPSVDLIHQFPLFVGHVNLARQLFFYDIYKQCYELAGDIADVGTWKGASFFLMAKFVRLFESHSPTQVHGFDWFKGMKPQEGVDCMLHSGQYTSEYNRILKLIDLQLLNDIAIIHKMDLVNELQEFFVQNEHMRFKLVFIDCGISEVLESAISHFWPRLVQGGIMVMDHYSVKESPKESEILEKYIGKNLVRKLPYVRQPTGYVIKEN